MDTAEKIKTVNDENNYLNTQRESVLAQMAALDEKLNVINHQMMVNEMVVRELERQKLQNVNSNYKNRKG